MPSKKELLAFITKAATELEEEVAIEGLDFAALKVLAKELGERVKAENLNDSKPPKPPKPPAPVESKAPEEVVKMPPFYMAPGKSMTTIGRGIVDAGEEILATDLSGGQKAIDAFIESGHIRKGD